MPEDHFAALTRRFNRYTKGSGVSGIVFYPQFVSMICDLYHITAPRGPYDSKQRWVKALWKEIDVEQSGSINFELFCTWYLKYFDPISGNRLSNAQSSRA
jgi:hypothetical protein